MNTLFRDLNLLKMTLFFSRKKEKQ